MTPLLYGPDNRPLPPTRRAAPGPRDRRAEVFGTPGVAYDAASLTSQELAGWDPQIRSPEAEIHPIRDRMVARMRDIVRNDGWASGGITRIVDAVVGGELRLVAKPDYRSLAGWAKGFDAAWAQDFQRTAEALWRDWGNDPARWCDLPRRHTIPQMMALAFRQLLVDGDALAILPWRPDRRGYGRARYATTVQLIDADRLCNPDYGPDTRSVRGGIELDDDGVAVAHHYRRGRLGDPWAAEEAMTWDRVARETGFGRPIVVHHFEADRVGQLRGAGGVFGPVLPWVKMIAQSARSDVQAGIVNALLGTFITSQSDPELVQEGLSDGSGDLTALQQLRSDYHGEARLSLNGMRIPVLPPGDNVTVLDSHRPSSGFEAFQRAALRNMASAIGMSAEQLSQDWSQTNYSSARAALIETWRTMKRRRINFGSGFAAPIYAAFLEEAMDRGELPLPAGAPAFEEARAAYAGCHWIGPARGWVDPVKEPTGAQLRMDSALGTLEDEAAEQGQDWEEVLDQRAIEVQAFRDRKLPLPEWAGQFAAAAAIQPTREDSA